MSRLHELIARWREEGTGPDQSNSHSNPNMKAYGRQKVKCADELEAALAECEPGEAQQWPSCKWCHMDLVRWVKKAGKCPNCGAIDFMEAQPATAKSTVCPNCNNSRLGPKDPWGRQQPCSLCCPEAAGAASKIPVR